MDQNYFGVHFLGRHTLAARLPAPQDRHLTVIKHDNAGDVAVHPNTIPIQSVYKQAFSQTPSNGSGPVQVLLNGPLADTYQTLQQNLITAMDNRLPEPIKTARGAYLAFRQTVADGIHQLEAQLGTPQRQVYSDMTDLKPSTVAEITSGE